MSTRTIDGLTPSQLAWMQSDYAAAKALGKTHTFIFTHGPIVGHGGLATHDDAYLRHVVGEYPHWVTTVDRDLPFVEWVNGAGMTVEAVFCGHTHQDHALYSSFCTLCTICYIEAHTSSVKASQAPSQFPSNPGAAGPFP